MKIVGIAGPHASGKDAFADYLDDNYGFYHVSLGDISREEAMKKYGSIERPVLYKTANEIREKYGAGALGDMAINKYRKVQDKYPAGLVVSGFRTTAEAEAVRKEGGIILYVDAPEDLRFARLVARARAEEGSLSYEEFKKREDAENGGVDPAFSIVAIKSIADSTIINDGSMDEFITLSKQAIGIE